MIKATDRIIGVSRGSEVEALGYAVAHKASRFEFTADYIGIVYDLCLMGDMPDAAIVIAQWGHETADPWPGQSFWWETRGNPAGLGITGDPVQNVQSERFETGEEAARAHVSHLLLYATGEINRGGLTPADDPRYDAYRDAYGNTPMALTINGLTGKWGVDPRYASGVVKWGNRIFPSVPNQGGSSVAIYQTTIPGLPGGPLQTTHPIQIKLIPEWRSNNRPGYTAKTPRRSVQHGNGNPRSSAAGEANYLFNGAEGRQASYHSATDDKETWVMVPANEVTWQAADGSGPGNMNGFSNEMVEDATLWANPTRRDRLIANAAELMGGVAARLDIDKPEQHWTFNYDSADRHDCPNKLRYTTINGRSAWEIYAEKWRAAKLAERTRMAGGGAAEATPIPPVKPVYADAVTIWMGNDLKELSPSDHSFTVKVEGVEVKVKVWGAEREYECVKSTPRYQWPDVKGKRVGGNLVVRERFVGSYCCTVGTTRWIVTRYGSWLRGDALTPRISVRAA